MTERRIEVADAVAVELAGEQDSVLRALEDRLGLSISLRGNRVILEGDDERVPQILLALQEVQMETVRMENQEAIIEGFGVLSGRVKGPAGK